MRTDDATLTRLMAMSQKGDKRAYATLLFEARNWLKSYLRRRVAPGHLEDVVQEVLVSLHTKLASYDPSRPFLPWLAAIARYRWVDHLRKLSRSDDAAVETEVIAESDEPAITARLSLERLFTMLPENQARVIEMVKVEGYSIAEASQASGQSESLVKVNIHRGIKRLAAIIEKE
ncbi:MAG: sigma-70 family RNA polymerase sigma factor [Sphingomonadaceae bacterium]|nr:sigma-70 family RNA polymerase sigma factor [Sphingomonadaceae bacterium]